MQIKGPVNGEPAVFEFDGNDVKAIEGFIRERLNEMYPPAPTFRERFRRFLLRLAERLERNES